MSPPLRLLLVDDSEVVRTGLRTLLALEPGFSIAAEAGTVAAALEAAARSRPDVALLDIRLPDGTGIDACREIIRLSPATRVLMLTSSDDGPNIDAAIRAGAHGYLLKEIDGRGLVAAIHQVAAGRSILDPAVTGRVLGLVRQSGGAGDPLASLSSQEGRVLALIAEGCTNKEAAAKLGLSEKTVKNYLGTIFEKLHVSRRAEAAALYAQARRSGS